MRGFIVAFAWLSAAAGLGPSKHEGALEQLPEIASGALAAADKTAHKTAAAPQPLPEATAPKPVVDIILEAVRA